MKKEITMPKAIARFIRALNEHDADAFLSSFSNGALVTDGGREFRGTAAIKEWGKSEIFEFNVTLDVVNVTERDGVPQLISPSGYCGCGTMRYYGSRRCP